MKKLLFCAVLASVIFSSFTSVSFAYTINGQYARLVSCEYGYSAVRGESGYTGVYEVLGEMWTVYFGGNYCSY